MITAERCECNEGHEGRNKRCSNPAEVLGHYTNDRGNWGDTLCLCTDCAKNCTEDFVIEETL